MKYVAVYMLGKISLLISAADFKSAGGVWRKELTSQPSGSTGIQFQLLHVIVSCHTCICCPLTVDLYVHREG